MIVSVKFIRLHSLIIISHEILYYSWEGMRVLMKSWDIWYYEIFFKIMYKFKN